MMGLAYAAWQFFMRHLMRFLWSLLVPLLPLIYPFIPVYKAVTLALFNFAFSPTGATAIIIFTTFTVTQLRAHCYGPVGYRRPPGPWVVLPFLGDTMQMLKEGPLSYFLARVRKYGPVFRTHLFGEAMYVLADFTTVQVMLRDYGADMHVPGPAFKWLVTDSDHLRGAKVHQPWKRYMVQALRPSAIEQYAPRIQQIIDERLDAWAKDLQCSLGTACSELAMDFGVDIVSGITFKVPRTRAWAKQQFSIVNRGLYAVPINWPGSELNQALVSRRMLRDGLKRDIVECVKQMKRKYESCEDASKLEATNLLESQVYSMLPAAALSYERVFDRTLGNIVAAADATKNMMFSALFLTASVPRVYEKLRDEQRQMMAADNSAAAPQWRDVAALPYLDAAVKEAVRLLPAAFGGFRRLQHPLSVGTGGYVIPEGATVLYSTHLLHALDPAVSGNCDAGGGAALPPCMDTTSHERLAEAFRPERWLEQAETTGATSAAAEGSGAESAPPAASPAAPPRQFSTFGGGVHMCPGMGLAVAETKLLLVALLRRFRWQLQDLGLLQKCPVRFPYPIPELGSDFVTFVEDKL